MSKRDIFIVPVAPYRDEAVVAARGKSAAGVIRLGVLDNGKSNADHLLAMFVEGARGNLPLSSVVSLRKCSAAAGAEHHMLDQLAAQADFVVSAMAD